MSLVRHSHRRYIQTRDLSRTMVDRLAITQRQVRQRQPNIAASSMKPNPKVSFAVTAILNAHAAAVHTQAAAPATSNPPTAPPANYHARAHRGGRHSGRGGYEGQLDCPALRDNLSNLRGDLGSFYAEFVKAKTTIRPRTLGFRFSRSFSSLRKPPP